MDLEESQTVLAACLSSQGLQKDLWKLSDVWEFFTEGKVLSLWTPRRPFPYKEVSC